MIIFKKKPSVLENDFFQHLRTIPGKWWSPLKQSCRPAYIKLWVICSLSMVQFYYEVNLFFYWSYFLIDSLNLIYAHLCTEKNIGLSNTRRRRKTKEGAYSHFSFLPWYSFRGATHLQEGRRNWFMALRCTLLYLPCFSSLAAMNHYANLFFCLSPVLEVQQNCTKSEFHQNHFTRSFPNFSGLIFDFGEINILKIFLKNSPAAFALKLYENILHGIQLPGMIGFPLSKKQSNSRKL